MILYIKKLLDIYLYKESYLQVTLNINRENIYTLYRER